MLRGFFSDRLLEEEGLMAYVVAQPCVNVLDRACVEVCPVQCFYEGGDQLIIHPQECVDCDACKPVCPTARFEDGDPTMKTSSLACIMLECPPRRRRGRGPGRRNRLLPLGACRRKKWFSTHNTCPL